MFSGGKRHHEIVAPLLPADAEWIDITAPLDAVFEQYHVQCSIFNVQCITVFASGDPLFFGFANTIKRKMPEAEINIYPTFNSLQMLAHRLVMPYHDMRIVSLTGRPWPEFDRALIENSRVVGHASQRDNQPSETPCCMETLQNSRHRFQALQGEQNYGMAGKIGVLTDKERTPAAIARRMLEYGYTEYTMHVGEHLGNPVKEKVTTLTLEEAAQRDFDHPNCVILNSCNPRNSWLEKKQQFGIPDNEFALLDGREKMITKMPIRLLTLQALGLPHRHVLWDIGACTGSVSIEARLQFPHLQIEAFEIRPECEAIIHENARRFGAPGINVHIGDFLNFQLSTLNLQLSTLNLQLSAPDAVFIGGHGGHLKEIMAKVLTVLAPDGIIVFNSVTSPKVHANSRQMWDEACSALGLTQEKPLHIQLDNNNPINILKATRK